MDCKLGASVQKTGPESTAQSWTPGQGRLPWPRAGWPPGCSLPASGSGPDSSSQQLGLMMAEPPLPGPLTLDWMHEEEYTYCSSRD